MTSCFPAPRGKETGRTSPARSISRGKRDYQGKKLMIIGVLKGSVVFMSDLLRRITIPVEMDFMAVSSYGSGTKISGGKSLSRPDLVGIRTCFFPTG